MQLCHRDIKLENFILINKRKLNIKLIDFGLAKKLEDGKKIYGKPVGTPYYIAPELLLGESDCKSDVWSAGVILYMLLTGKPLYDGLTDKDIIFNIKNEQPNFGSKEFQTLSESCQDLLKKLLDKNPYLRITATEALDHPWITSSYLKTP